MEFKLTVCAKRCNQCLFSNAKIVEQERKLDVLATCEADNTHFVCHKHSIKGRNTCCRGFYDDKNLWSLFMRLCALAKGFTFIDE